MIPRDYITEWRAHAPWIQDLQVEQDLVICRALIEIFSHPLLKDAIQVPRRHGFVQCRHVAPAATGRVGFV